MLLHQVLFVHLLAYVFVCFQQHVQADLSLHCELFCDQQLISDEDDFDLICNKSCKLQECKIGCAKWFTYSNLLNCDQICERKKGGQPIESIYCNIGCNQAFNLYANKSRSEIGNPSAPFLAGDSLRNDSIVLQWKISSHHNVSYLIQFRYSQLNTDWIFYRPDHPIRTDHALIQNLQPYTAYRFRVLWLLNDVTNVPQTSRYTSNFEATSPTLRPRPLISTPVSKADSAPTPFDSERLQPIYSEESVEIRTLPYGSPSVAPRLVGCLPLSPERILITYDPPRFPNDRLIGFALTATPIEHTPNQVDPADQLHRDLKAPNDDMQTQHYTLSPLQANRTYTIKLSAINGFGTGPSAQLNCSTPIDPHRSSSIAKSIAHQTSKSSSSSWISSSPLSEEPQLIFATPKTIALKRSSLPLEPVHTLLRLDDFTQNENFTAIAVHVQRGLVFTADTSGSIRRLNLQSEVTLRILQKSQLLVGWHPLAESVQVRILDMTVDWLNDRLYLVRQIRWPSIHSIRRSHLRDTALHNAMQSLNSYSTYSEQIELLRCNLDGADLRPLLRFDYGQLPVNVQIDPINGYLFWSAINNYHHLPHLQSQQFNSWWMEDVASVSSLDSIDEAMPIVPKPSISSTVYRIDLALLIANHTLSSALAESIVKLAGSQAPAFTLSPSDMRLLYVHHTQSNQSTIVRSITLDGHDAIDIREDRVERSLFQPRMRNLALFDQLLFWTMGNETFREHFASGRYFHNAIFVDQRLQPMLALRLAHPSLQPYPRPISPVVSLQALLLRTDAKIRWQAPAPLFGAGQAAFSRWKYELCIGELNAHFSTINSKRILSNAFKVNQTAESLSADSNKSNFWPPDKVSQLRKRICFELSDTFCALGQLKTNTSYVFRVRPLSPAGVGPWSNGFYGSTLPELPLSNTEKYRNWTQQFGGNKFIAPDSLYLSTEIGLIRSNLLGESVETIILPGAVQRQPLRHLAIFQQHLFANLANGSLLHVPLHAAPPGQSLLHHQAQIIGRITGASCVSIDWLTPKLYFANEVQQTISRCNFDGSSVETLPLFSTVKELRIDPINAFLYWSTGHAIEVASLNALVKYKYFQTAPFSGHLVQGLAIDYDQQSLYFLVKTVDAVMLYTGRLLTGDLTDSRPKEPLYTLHTTLPPSFALNGPVVAYADKLLWLTADQKAMITDQAGGNAAMVSTAQQVHSLALIDGHEPKALDRLNVVPIVTPDSINKTSIKIDGQPSNFTISWQSVTNVNFGRVRYELILETQEKLFELHLNEPRYQYPSASSADTSSSSLITSSSIGSVSLPVFKIAIRAYTPWAYSRRTVIFPKSSSSGRGNSSVNKPLYFEPPRRPSLTKLIKIKGGTYELTWTCDPIEHSTLSGASNSNEPPFLSLIYAVFRKPVAGDRWSLVYNGTDNRAYINFPDNELKQSHLIKLIAFNQFGESDPLHYNLNPSLDELIESQHSFDRSLMFVLVAVLATLAVAALIFYYWCKFVCKQANEKHKLDLNSNLSSYAPTELATLSNYPIGSAPSAGSNQNHLYLSSEMCGNDSDLAALNQVPHVQKEQLTVIGYLGRGAFGEVFRGLVQYSDGQNEKVAIKLLRDNSQRSAFLKEALLMKNFKHPHILRLVGICLTNQPMCLLFELMDDGDMLSFLRNRRPDGTCPSPLSLAELIEMCVHVADGCCYLEQKHFVHRDLAARNCLVSTEGDLPGTGRRVVKIGDFGLTRDLYKADYYRKEGEGLLPVRWMPPESLVDGVFTTQSDAWSFGVLLWEVCTLGQQPYPARSNLEVLEFVQNGGRLDRPDTCPQELFDLMVQCWNFMPEERPSFAYCLHVLQSMHKKLSTVNQITSVHNQNYIYNGTSGSGSCITPDLPHSEAMLPGTAAGSAANIECRYSIGKKAGLIEVNSLRLLKPENLTSIDLNDCNICCDSTHDQDGYKLPVEVLGCI